MHLKLNNKHPAWPNQQNGNNGNRGGQSQAGAGSVSAPTSTHIGSCGYVTIELTPSSVRGDHC